MDDTALANYYDSLKAKGPKGKSGLGFHGPGKKTEGEAASTAADADKAALMAKYGGMMTFQAAGTAKDVARSTIFNSDDEEAAPADPAGSFAATAKPKAETKTEQPAQQQNEKKHKRKDDEEQQEQQEQQSSEKKEKKQKKHKKEKKEKRRKQSLEEGPTEEEPTPAAEDTPEQVEVENHKEERKEKKEKKEKMEKKEKKDKKHKKDKKKEDE